MLAGFVKVADVHELRDNDMMMVQAGPEEILLARVNGEYYAVASSCTHADGMLDMGFLDPDKGEVECPLHGGHFDLRTGAATMGPPEEPLATYAVRIEGADILVGPK